jgi:hypothetical protein
MNDKVKETVKNTESLLDKFFNKVIPKKFLVWGVLTFALLAFEQPRIPGDLYVYFSMVYVLGNVVQKFSTSGIEFREKKDNE